MDRLPIKSLGIIGGGVLGQAICRGFMEWCDVRVYDLDPSRATHVKASAASADMVMIALPTPANSDGTCNTTAIDDFLDEAKRCGWWTSKSCYVIRSTVPVGYTDRNARREGCKLPLFHSPEFLTARCSVVDFQTPSRNIIGVPEVEKYSSAGAVYGPALELAYQTYRQRFSGVQTLVMSSNASELVKLASNTFFGIKVTAFNLFRDIAIASGCRWEDVRDGLLTDGRIAHAHTEAPGPDGLPGFGGTCIPKDLSDLYHCAKSAGVDAEFLRAILARNTACRAGLDEKLAKITLE